MRLEYELQLLYASAYLASSAIQLELNVDKQVALSKWVNIINNQAAPARLHELFVRWATWSLPAYG